MEEKKRSLSFREVFANLNYTDEELMAYPEVKEKPLPVWPPKEEGAADKGGAKKGGKGSK